MKISLHFVAPLLLFSNQVFAMNLNAVYQEALKKNENVPAQEESLNQAEELVYQGYGGVVPTLSLTQQFFWQDTPSASTSSFSPSYQPQTAIQAKQPLLQGFREYEAIRMVKRKRDSARATKENVELDIYKQVVAAYYNILSLERDLENVKEKSKYLKDRINDLNHMHKIGRSQLTDVLTAKSTAAANDVVEEQDRINLASARNAFALLTGLPADTKLDDDTGTFVPSLGPIVTYTDRIKERPEVRAARASAEANNYSVEIARADHLPSVDLTGNYYFDRPRNFEGVDWDAKVVITLPLFAGGVTQSKLRVAHSQARQTDLALSLAERKADQEIRNLYDMVASDLRQRALTEENIRLSEMTFKEEQRSYKFGLVNNIDVLNSLTNFIEAKRGFDTNRFNLRRDFLTLKAAAVVK